MVTIRTRPGPGRFMFVDAGVFGAGAVRAVMEQAGAMGAGQKELMEKPLETVFVKARSAEHVGKSVSNQDGSGDKGEDAFGTYLSMPDTEHEFGKLPSLSMAFCSLARTHCPHTRQTCRERG